MKYDKNIKSIKSNQKKILIQNSRRLLIIIWFLQQLNKYILTDQKQMSELFLKKLTQQQMERLKELKQDVQKMKELKQKQHVNKQSLNRLNMPSLKQLQADRYLRMCYLMLRHGLYGAVKQNPQFPYKNLSDYLKFYKDTYQFDDSKERNTKKLHIFEAIEQSQIKDYINQLVIKKIQELAKNVHIMFKAFFSTYRMEKKLQTSFILKDNYQKALEQIIIFIDDNYVWDRWDIIPSLTYKYDQKLSNLEGLNAQTLIFINSLVSKLKQLSKNEEYQKRFNSIFQHFKSQKIKEKNQFIQKVKEQRQKSKQYQSEFKKQQEDLINKIPYQESVAMNENEQLTQQQIERISKQHNQQQGQQQQLKISSGKAEQKREKEINSIKQMQIVHERLIEQNKSLLDTLMQFSLIKQSQEADQKIKNPTQQGITKLKLKQKLNEFNYGMMQKSQIKKLGFKDLMKQVKIREMSQFMLKKERNKFYLENFGKVYEKHSIDSSSK